MLLTVSLGSTSHSLCSRMGPVSSPSSAQNTVNPPFWSPWIRVLSGSERQHMKKCLLFLRQRVLSCDPPVDGRGSSVARQQRRVVDDGAQLGVIDHLHGDELGAEGQDVELGAGGGVLSHHLWDGLTFDPPARELEDGNAVLFRLSGLKTHSCCFQRHCNGEKKKYDLLFNSLISADITCVLLITINSLSKAVNHQIKWLVLVLLTGSNLYHLIVGRSMHFIICQFVCSVFFHICPFDAT